MLSSCTVHIHHLTIVSCVMESATEVAIDGVASHEDGECLTQPNGHLAMLARVGNGAVFASTAICRSCDI